MLKTTTTGKNHWRKQGNLESITPILLQPSAIKYPVWVIKWDRHLDSCLNGPVYCRSVVAFVSTYTTAAKYQRWLLQWAEVKMFTTKTQRVRVRGGFQ